MTSRTHASTVRLALFTDTYAPQVNGVARTLERLVQAISERGGEARVFTVDDPAAVTQAHIDRYPSRPFWAYDQLRLSWPSRRRVDDAFRAFAPTLVHSATEFGVGLAGRAAARRWGVPFVSSYHTSFTSYAQYYRLGFAARPGWRYLRWFHNAGRRTYCPTASIVNEVNAQGFLRTAVWSRGVDTTRFSPRFRSDVLRAHYNAHPETLVVAYVGRMAAEKGLDVGLEAVRLADAARPGMLRFIAVGDGPYDTQVRRLAPDGSWLPGALTGDALSQAYASADVFLFPSTTDTFGNVLLEAMASGLPVVGADVGPTREQLAPDRGWLVSPRDPRAYADALIALVDNRALLHNARARGLAFAQEKSWPVVWDTLIADYIALQGAPALARGAPTRAAPVTVPA
ncbi:MAG: glycosyltransferase family 1 protein [Gemmatimonadaceae bacterium]|nr:glycosyltransferase family 1 protein [Gemmatimonadaceae bacterium]